MTRTISGFASVIVLLSLLSLNCNVDFLNVSAKSSVSEAEIKAEDIARLREEVERYGEEIYLSITLAEGEKIEDYIIEGTEYKNVTSLDPNLYSLKASKEIMLKYIDMYEADDSSKIVYLHGEGDAIAVAEYLGDVNSDGKVDLTDLTVLSLALIGESELTATQQRVADVDGDGEVKLADLARMRQFVSKIVEAF